MALFVEQPHLISQFGSESKKMISPFTPQASAQRLGSVVHQVLGVNKFLGTNKDAMSSGAAA